MTLVLHIGSHKTGTTAVQRFAAAHRAILRERGLWYPSYDEIGLPEHYAHHHFAHAIADAARGKFDIGDAERFSAAVRRGRRKGETVLLSAEPIYRHVLKGPDDYWAQREAYVARLKEMMAPPSSMAPGAQMPDPPPQHIPCAWSGFDTPIPGPRRSGRNR